MKGLPASVPVCLPSIFVPAVLLEVLLRVVGEIEDLFGNQGTSTSNVDELNRRILPLLQRAASLQGSLPPPDNHERLVLQVLEEWDLVVPILKFP